MLDGPEIEFEGLWRSGRDEPRTGMVSLSFIDGSLGGTGYFSRVAAELHLVARRALEHLDHPGCGTACYRCLKSYRNQRFHQHLRWPLAAPSRWQPRPPSGQSSLVTSEGRCRLYLPCVADS